jgi:hypothetical protein
MKDLNWATFAKLLAWPHINGTFAWECRNAYGICN